MKFKQWMNKNKILAAIIFIVIAFLIIDGNQKKEGLSKYVVEAVPGSVALPLAGAIPFVLSTPWLLIPIIIMLGLVLIPVIGPFTISLWSNWLNPQPFSIPIWVWIIGIFALLMVFKMMRK